MKKNLLFSLLTMALMVGACDSDSKEEDYLGNGYDDILNQAACLENIQQGAKDNISGVWKYIYSSALKKDYSCNDVFWIFHSDSLLTIVSSITEMPEKTYTYSYRPLETGVLQLPSPNLIIKNNDKGTSQSDYFFATVLNSKMKLTLNYESQNPFIGDADLWINSDNLFIRTNTP